MPELPPAGWYPDPEQPQTQRYWDGSAWTDQRAPAAPAASTSSTPGAVLAAGGCAGGMLVGSIGPWVNAGFISVGGLDGDGVIVLCAAIAALVAVVVAVQSSKVGGLIAMVVMLAGILAAATSIYDIINIQSSETRLFGEEIRIGSPGWGLWLSAATSVGLAVSGAAIFQLGKRT